MEKLFSQSFSMLTFVVILINFLDTSSSAKIVCYYASWAASFKYPATVHPEDLQVELCTHLIYAFVTLGENGTLVPLHEDRDIIKKGYTRTTKFKNINPSLKILLSVGSTSSTIFSSVAHDEIKRNNLVKSARSLMEIYNFDGIDIDWEFPQVNDSEHFVNLFQDLKNDFHRDNYIVSAAVRAFPSIGYDVPSLNSIVDFFNVMNYNYYGPWSAYTGHNSALYPSCIESKWEKEHLNVAANIQEWLQSGASPEKIIVGIPFYGRTYKLKDSCNNSIHAPFIGPGPPGPFRKGTGSLAYLEFCMFRGNWTRYRWSAQQKAAMFYHDDLWLSIETRKSIMFKISFIKSKCLGGAMIWSIDQDDVHGHCGRTSPLLGCVSDNLL